MRIELEKIARETEGRLSSTKDQSAFRFLEGHAFGIRRALCASAPRWMALELSFEEDVRSYPAQMHDVEGAKVAATFANLVAGTSVVPTLLTFVWDATGAILSPEQTLGSFGLEEGDRLRVVPAPNVDFERPWLPGSTTLISQRN